jgi:hypothetical protein
MELSFSENEMTDFLKIKGYKIALWPAVFLVRNGPEEEEKKISVNVAIKKADALHIGELYWSTDIDRIYGLKNVFTKELKKALLRL